MFSLKVLNLTHVASFFFYELLQHYWHKPQSFLSNQRLRHYAKGIRFWEEKKSLEVDVLSFCFVFASGPKMADAQTPFCASLLRFRGAVSQPRVQSEAAGGSHIYRHLCVYQRLRSGSQSTQGLPAGMGSVFWQKRKRIPGTEANGSFPSSSSSSDHMPGSQ